jgi:hypothetical protein
MPRLLKKYSSIFLLLLFLFPMTEKALHAYEHQSDTHCTSTDKHFHAPEHSCDLCDLSISSSDPLPSTEILFRLSAGTFSFTPFISGSHSPAAFQDLPSRAPPVA